MKDLLARALPYVPADLAEEIQDALRKSTGRATRLAQDWTPDPSLLSWAARERPDVCVSREVEQFKDFWLSKSGANATKIDWPRTFKVWMRNARSSPKPVLKSEPLPSPATVVARRKVAEPPSQAVRDMMAELASKLRINTGSVA